MERYAIRRLAQAVLIVLCVSLIVFIFINLAPRDPYTQRLDPSVSAEVREEMLERLGYYDPVHIKYFKWLSAVAHGDLGY